MKARKRNIIILGTLYCLIFVSFGFIYWKISDIGRGDLFIFKENMHIKQDHNIFDFMYFSVVTITTLGYGDILPNSRLVRLFVMIESISGVTIMGMLASCIFKDEK